MHTLTRSPDDFIEATYPAYLPGTDVKIREEDLRVRIRAAGDNEAMWDVQFEGIDGHWHTLPRDQAPAVLRHIEATQIGDWEDILAAA